MVLIVVMITLSSPFSKSWTSSQTEVFLQMSANIDCCDDGDDNDDDDDSDDGDIWSQIMMVMMHGVVTTPHWVWSAEMIYHSPTF